MFKENSFKIISGYIKNKYQGCFKFPSLKKYIKKLIFFFECHTWKILENILKNFSECHINLTIFLSSNLKAYGDYTTMYFAHNKSLSLRIWANRTIFHLSSEVSSFYWIAISYLNSLNANKINLILKYSRGSKAQAKNVSTRGIQKNISISWNSKWFLCKISNVWWDCVNVIIKVVKNYKTVNWSWITKSEHFLKVVNLNFRGLQVTI